MSKKFFKKQKFEIDRRSFLKTSSASIGTALTSQLISSKSIAAKSRSNIDNKILVVLELSGGNDGLNTIVPYADDVYYKLRPKIGLRENQLLKVDDHFGFNPGIVGLERLFKDGKMAIVHAAGYDNPSFSHFTSMAYYHTAAPNSGEEYGWIGRLADNMQDNKSDNLVINIDNRQSLAVTGKATVPVVFDEPEKFKRKGLDDTSLLLSRKSKNINSDNKSLNYLKTIASASVDSSILVNQAWKNYRREVDYGIAPLDLDKIAALIKAELPTKIYYTSFRDNAFDTHVHQNNLHRRLLSYASDAIQGFMADIELMGRSEDVILLVFTEFGRRCNENTSLGTDHGAAGPIFILGKNIQGGHFGEIPDLSKSLDEGDNLKHTTDFRSVYATIIKDWFDIEPKTILKNDFPILNFINHSST